jgi:NAD(P)-dependent dehydrogenase (short-subunit alcohol dehydrogenase family)
LKRRERPELYRFANYSASKGGVIALTRATAAEYGPEGILANGIAPGWLGGTRLGEDARTSELDVEAIQSQLAARVWKVALEPRA